MTIFHELQKITNELNETFKLELSIEEKEEFDAILNMVYRDFKKVRITEKTLDDDDFMKISNSQHRLSSFVIRVHKIPQSMSSILLSSTLMISQLIIDEKT